ncbi:MAG: hypothetical protein GWN84_08890 [Gammaproteobacteria bacterium]|nr:hypothetical protein [Gammaproteobacteria bacterium]NIR82997.1 hypothetical protein [Gammaproteobacteria bacterium]NIR90652.1 hypothetical protein [Gammaproteobacteria bacterium]NIU04154.1 hypothetical protein [Gammaproteobacteria bacterium]NIV51445.1 hypothetical protein [Gammaproteobacteria bacterium]
MPRDKRTPGIQQYYDALTDVFRLESRVLTGVLPHYGERGRNDEDRLKGFLTRVVPQRFGIGTGFIVCSDKRQPVSSQTDVVIFDQLYNSPLYKELASDVYPVEIVYATVEVKGVLRKGDWNSTLEDIAKLRSLGRQKVYTEYVAVPKAGTPEHSRKIVVGRKHRRDKLPPRSYVFAYAKKGWRTLADFRDTLGELLEENKRAHIHRAVVLDEDWFLTQKAYTDPVGVVHAYDDNCLLRFTNHLLNDIQSFPMGTMSIDVYHEISGPQD